MKILLVDDEFTSLLILYKFLSPYGTTYIAMNGAEAVQAFRSALVSGAPYDLVCLDVLLPEKDGHTVLNELRQLEEQQGIFSSDGAKIIMVTVLGDMGNVMDAYQGLCDGYVVKPVDPSKLLELLRSFGYIQ